MSLTEAVAKGIDVGGKNFEIYERKMRAESAVALEYVGNVGL